MNAESPATLIGLPDLKVELAGSLDVPVVVNHSDRNIIGYILHVEDDSGMPTNIPVYPMTGIPPGAKDVFIRVSAPVVGEQSPPRQVRKDGTPVVVSRISLDSVVFADGEFAGPDIAQAYRLVVAHVRAMRANK